MDIGRVEMVRYTVNAIDHTDSEALRDQLLELCDAILANESTLPQQHPRYVAGFKAGVEYAREDDYGGDPDDDGMGPLTDEELGQPDNIRTTNPDGYVTLDKLDDELNSMSVTDQELAGVAPVNYPTPDEVTVALSIKNLTGPARVLADAVQELSWMVRRGWHSGAADRCNAVDKLARAVEEMDL